MNHPGVEWDENLGCYVKNKMMEAYEELDKLEKGALIIWVLGFMVWAQTGQDPLVLDGLLKGYLPPD